MTLHGRLGFWGYSLVWHVVLCELDRLAISDEQDACVTHVGGQHLDLLGLVLEASGAVSHPAGEKTMT